MAYVVLLSEQSKTELAAIKRSGDKATIKKITNMLLELQEHPRTGTGQVEHLKHYVFEETWSRRINKQYRMIYEIHDLEVYVSVVSLRSHYGDKWLLHTFYSNTCRNIACFIASHSWEYIFPYSKRSDIVGVAPFGRLDGDAQRGVGAVGCQAVGTGIGGVFLVFKGVENRLFTTAQGDCEQ